MPEVLGAMRIQTQKFTIDHDDGTDSNSQYRSSCL